MMAKESLRATTKTVMLFLLACVTASAEWPYEVLPTSYDDVAVTPWGVVMEENPVTGQPAILWRGDEFLAEDGSVVSFTLYFAQRTGSGWPPYPEVVDEIVCTDGVPYVQFHYGHHDLAFDSQGVPAVAFGLDMLCQPPGTGFDTCVFFAKRETAGWPTADLIDSEWLDVDFPPPGYLMPKRVALDFGANDEVGIVYSLDYEDEEEEGIASIRYSSNDGEGWDIGVGEWTYAYSGTADLDIGFDKRGTADFLAHVSMNVAGDIKYTVQTSTSWTTPVSLKGSIQYVGSKHSMELDPLSDFRPRVVFDASSNVYYTAYDGTTWSTPTAVTSNVSGLNNSQLRILGGIPHVVRGEESSYDGPLWDFLPAATSGFWSCLTVADDVEDKTEVAFAVDHLAGTKYVFHRGSDTLDGRGVVALSAPLLFDNFDDENTLGWYAWPSSTWSASGGYLRKTSNGAASSVHAHTQPDSIISFSYWFDGTSTGDLAAFTPRYQSNDDKIRVVFRRNSMRLDKRVGGVWSIIVPSNTSFPTATGVWYDVVVACEGSTTNVWRGVRGGVMQHAIVNASNPDVLGSAYLQLTTLVDDPPDQVRFDNVHVQEF